MTRALCSLDDCDLTTHARGYCHKHWRRFMKHGDPHAIGDTGRPLSGANPTHAAIHKRLSRRRGPASSFTCVDCGKRARDWSYDGLDLNQLESPQGPYSTDLSHYQPRCVSCHRLYDRAGNRPRTAGGRFAPPPTVTILGAHIDVEELNQEVSA